MNWNVPQWMLSLLCADGWCVVVDVLDIDELPYHPFHSPTSHLIHRPNSLYQRSNDVLYAPIHSPTGFLIHRSNSLYQRIDEVLYDPTRLTTVHLIHVQFQNGWMQCVRSIRRHAMLYSCRREMCLLELQHIGHRRNRNRSRDPDQWIRNTM